MNPVVNRLLNQKFGTDDKAKEQFVNTHVNEGTIYFNSTSSTRTVSLIFIAENISEYKFRSMVAEFMDKSYTAIYSYEFRISNGFRVAYCTCNVDGWSEEYSFVGHESFTHKDITFFKALGVYR